MSLLSASLSSMTVTGIGPYVVGPLVSSSLSSTRMMESPVLVASLAPVLGLGVAVARGPERSIPGALRLLRAPA